MDKQQKLKINSKATVYVDYANVYGWRHHLSKPLKIIKLLKYLKTYNQIKSINFYYGSDNNSKSKNFIKFVSKIGYNLTTKPVKHIFINKDTKIRKCDFDIEICMSVYSHLDKSFDSYIFFSGDGDFAPLYQYLISKHKQAIVIYTQGHLGKEIWEIKKGLFKTELKNLPVF